MEEDEEEGEFKVSGGISADTRIADIQHYLSVFSFVCEIVDDIASW